MMLGLIYIEPDDILLTKYHRYSSIQQNHQSEWWTKTSYHP